MLLGKYLEGYPSRCCLCSLPVVRIHTFFLLDLSVLYSFLTVSMYYYYVFSFSLTYNLQREKCANLNRIPWIYIFIHVCNLHQDYNIHYQNPPNSLVSLPSHPLFPPPRNHYSVPIGWFSLFWNFIYMELYRISSCIWTLVQYYLSQCVQIPQTSLMCLLSVAETCSFSLW